MTVRVDLVADERLRLEARAEGAAAGRSQNVILKHALPEDCNGCPLPSSSTPITGEPSGVTNGPAHHAEPGVYLRPVESAGDGDGVNLEPDVQL